MELQATKDDLFINWSTNTELYISWFFIIWYIHFLAFGRIFHLQKSLSKETWKISINEFYGDYENSEKKIGLELVTQVWVRQINLIH